MTKNKLNAIIPFLNSFETYCAELISKGSTTDICSCVDELITTANELMKDHQAFVGRPFHMTQVTLKRAELSELLSQANSNIVGRIECTSCPFGQFDFARISGDGGGSTFFANTLAQQQSTSSIHEPRNLKQCRLRL